MAIQNPVKTAKAQVATAKATHTGRRTAKGVTCGDCPVNLFKEFGLTAHTLRQAGWTFQIIRDWRGEEAISQTDAAEYVAVTRARSEQHQREYVEQLQAQERATEQANEYAARVERIANDVVYQQQRHGSEVYIVTRAVMSKGIHTEATDEQLTAAIRSVLRKRGNVSGSYGIATDDDLDDAFTWTPVGG